jgi:hypothetical protein
LFGRPVETWKAKDREVRRKEEEIYRQHVAFVEDRIKGCFHKKFARWDFWLNKGDFGKLMAITDMYTSSWMNESEQYQEEVEGARSTAPCIEHHQDICYCASYPWKASADVGEVRWMDLRSKALHWPRSRLPARGYGAG